LKSHSIDPYRELMSILTQHYTNLLNAKGEKFGDLILSAYPKKTQYLLMIDDINNAWRSLNQTIVQDLAKTTPAAADTVRKIEDSSMEIRNVDIKAFY